MIPTLRETISALYGAWRLMRFDAGGMAWFEISLPAFRKSFFAAVLVAPIHAVLVISDLAAAPDAVDPVWAAVVFTVAYVATWASLPIAAIFITRFLGLGERYFALIIALNWAAVPQMLVLGPIYLIYISGLFSGPAAEFVLTAMLIFILVYQWYVTHSALGAVWYTTLGVFVIEVVLHGIIDVVALRLV